MPVRAFWACLLLACSLGLTSAQAEVAVPPLQARVTDLTGTLSVEQRASLEQGIAALETRKGSQIAVLLVPTTEPESIEQYSIRVAEAWKLGRKGVDDGVLLLVAKNDRALRIEVGYGLEGVIPDAVAKRVISEIIVPHFKQGDYYGGIQAGVGRLVRLIEGEPLPPPQRNWRSTGGVQNFFENAFPIAFVFVFVVGGILRGLLGRLPGASVAGVIAFIGAWLLLGSFLIALIIAFVAFILTLSGGSGLGSYRGGGFGGGAGGGGGFSGGGGGFGGGGASGRW